MCVCSPPGRGNGVSEIGGSRRRPEWPECAEDGESGAWRGRRGEQPRGGPAVHVRVFIVRRTQSLRGALVRRSHDLLSFLKVCSGFFVGIELGGSEWALRKQPEVFVFVQDDDGSWPGERVSEDGGIQVAIALVGSLGSLLLIWLDL